MRPTEPTSPTAIIFLHKLDNFLLNQIPVASRYDTGRWTDGVSNDPKQDPIVLNPPHIFHAPSTKAES
jgi:hypothetical protein